MAGGTSSGIRSRERTRKRTKKKIKIRHGTARHLDTARQRRLPARSVSRLPPDDASRPSWQRLTLTFLSVAAAGAGFRACGPSLELCERRPKAEGSALPGRQKRGGLPVAAQTCPQVRVALSFFLHRILTSFPKRRPHSSGICLEERFFTLFRPCLQEGLCCPCGVLTANP